MMANLIVVLLIAAMLFAALRYIYKAKKSGKKCIGCPDGGACAMSKNGGHCSCHQNNH
ncbi:MAG: FeoB-associated Cys-rich membrane protein [Peptococcaceae bacterium]|nr:FeoB-associated Cys-rich membrane protein [Peptococcaceae bacterium]